jgi:DNA-binding transcriptional LysR family regulator
MNLNHLQAFLTLAETLNFTRAAKALGITQPSISRQIKSLEEELGIPLFHRDHHSVALTPEGSDLRTSLQPLLEEVQTRIRTSRDRSETVEGPLAFSCLPEVGQHFFMKLLVDFRDQHPQIDLRIRFAMDDDIVRRLKAGLLDFGVVRTPLLGESLRSYKLMEERSVLVTRTENTQRITQIRTAEFVAYHDADSVLAEFIERYYPDSDLSRIRRFSTVNSHRSMVELLLTRDAYALLPYFVVQSFIQAGKLKIASDREIFRTFYLVHLDTGSTMTAKKKAFREYILKAARERSQQFGIG